MDTEADETDDESFPLARAGPVESDAVARLFHAALCSCLLVGRISMHDGPGEKWRCDWGCDWGERACNGER